MAKYNPDLSLLFHALADPTRRAILTRLAAGPAPVTELAQPTGLRLPTVMRHLAVLEEAGLIATAKDGRVRSCAIVPEALVPVRTWLD
jgi:DNA-binding transcriptional ArsR family regulator